MNENNTIIGEYKFFQINLAGEILMPVKYVDIEDGTSASITSVSVLRKYFSDDEIFNSIENFKKDPKIFSYRNLSFVLIFNNKQEKLSPFIYLQIRSGFSAKVLIKLDNKFLDRLIKSELDIDASVFTNALMPIINTFTSLSDESKLKLELGD